MSTGNTFGKHFRITTFGESHGPGVGVVVDGCPAGLPLELADIQRQLDRRRPGQSKVTTPRKEADEAEILSGVFEGKTTGMPIALLVRNTNTKSEHYDNLKDTFRPGHADYTFWRKYGHRDHRGGGRQSARETIGRVAAGAIAMKLLERVGVHVLAHTVQVGAVRARKFEPEQIESNPVRCADPEAAARMEEIIMEARKAHDSLGGVIEARATGVPPGWGEPVFDKLDALIGHAMLSIPATKGVEIGAGFSAASMKGSEHNDPFRVDANGNVVIERNNAGGMLGGISTGAPVVVRVAFKPTSSIFQRQQTINSDLANVDLEIEGRHDPCLVPRGVPIVEAMLALVLCDLMMAAKNDRLD